MVIITARVRSIVDLAEERFGVAAEDGHCENRRIWPEKRDECMRVRAPESPKGGSANRWTILKLGADVKSGYGSRQKFPKSRCHVIQIGGEI